MFWHSPGSGYITRHREDWRYEYFIEKRALKHVRKRLTQRGMASFEVLGLAADRELIRSLAWRLAGDALDAAQVRAALHRAVPGEPPGKGGILSAGLDLTRPAADARKVDQ